MDCTIVYFHWQLILAMVTTWQFPLSVYVSASIPSIVSNIALPIFFASVAFNLSSATTPVTMFLNDGSGEKGLLSWRKPSKARPALFSLAYLAFDASLCCSLVTNVVSVSSCIAMLISAQAGISNSHLFLCISPIPWPLVSQPVNFMLRIRTCSMTKSGESPAQ